MSTSQGPGRGVEVRHLRAFLAVAEEGSVTRAAARLRVSQPVVSRTLAALEGRLGVRLVDRSTHHLALTPEGAVFRDKAALAVSAFDDAVTPGRPHSRPLRLGHAWSALGPYTTPLLRTWQQRCPQTPLELLRIDDRTAGLARGEVDAAVLRGPVDTPGIVTEVLYTEGRVAAVAADGPLAARASLSLADLTAGAVVLNTVSGTTTLGLWPQDDRPAATLTVANTDDWLTAIAAGRGAGVSGSSTAGTHPHAGVAYRPLEDAPPLPVLLARRDGPAHPALPELLSLAREIVTWDGE
ncbi:MULTISPECIES: LysR family transcriptional regulator [unclassified Streptomyces]|uniref:LysR family transcriptional regulator n=1 Tax=unclassified Streptomyces TaxID=2593676 RepID=UPI0001C18970|nr:MULTISPECIES: LysR family transcriptional regulator [unclassified Streptomyces]AEN11658.1 transcriptional regulator, LysR family [Streptomyces sp. SirexAA-E]MYR66545.1 LysR family transcriptional regulator [Streptomyces sp. SID4939]MYR99580.1 LysR family transcriptional regulator [Streptomyces sp. SID4940]MYT61819.1 LysR family transcriptional regulator [Streptomyces sp. SID8357]MYT85189.1 LysR family transcriptional regulator [Streptomyces sp. SID8360]